MKTNSAGQVSAALLIIFLMAVVSAGVIMKTGKFFFRKAHLQNVADAAALDGGLWYARCLNILSLSNKLQAAAAAATAVSLLTGNPALLRLNTVIADIQDFIIGDGKYGRISRYAAPALICGMAVKNALKNDCVCLPFMNVKGQKSFLSAASVNVKRYCIEKISNRKVEYYFINHDYGRKMSVEKTRVHFNKRAKRWQISYGRNKGYFVTREVSYEKNSGKCKGRMLLEDAGEHTLLTAVFYKSGKNKENLSALSMVAISGGSMDILDLDAAGYEPNFERVILPTGGIPGIGGVIQKIGGKLIVH